MRERLVNTREEAERCLRMVRDANHITYDTETSGLVWQKCHIVGYVLTPLGEDSMYVPIRHAGGGNLPGNIKIPTDPHGWKGDLHWFEIELAKIANERPRHWVGHNLLFDMRFSGRHGVKLYGTHEDTGVNDPLCDENLYSYSLANCATRRGVQAKKGDELYQYMASRFGGEPTPKIMEHFWRTDASIPVVWQYAAGDGVTTEELWANQQEDLDKQDLRRVWGVECRLIKTLYRMTSTGIRISQSELERVDRHFKTLGEQAMASFPPGFKSNSPNALKEFLAHRIDANWPRNPVTAAQRVKARKDGTVPMGALKFDELTLKMIPEGRDILAARKLQHACSAFTQPMMERHLQPDGRVYCDIAQMASDDYGTISGRLSYYDPNLQQVPVRDKLIGIEYRKCFLPDEGHIWWDNDYKQQEYVVFTDYTGDPKLMQGYSSTPIVDIHDMVAQMLGIDRYPAKRMNLGLLYGMGVPKMALSLGVSIGQATIWMNEYHRQFPSAKRFLRKAERLAKERGYVHTYLGRRRRFDPSYAYKAGNGIIQGSSADITKLKMCEVDDYFASEGDIFRLMLQCHDSLAFSGPEDRGDIAREAIRIMGDFSEGQQISMRVPLNIDSDTGRNWSESTWGRIDDEA